MSQENVELCRAAWDAWQRGDFESWLEVIDPDIEWDFSAYPLPDHADRGRGRDGYLRFLGDYLGTWKAYEATAGEMIDAGDDVVAVVHETIRGRGSDIPIEREIFFVFTIRGGKAVRQRVYRTKEEALEAAGLGE